VIVRYFHFVRIRFNESENNPVLVVDPDAVFPFISTAQCLESIAGRQSKIFQPLCRIQVVQLARPDITDSLGELLASSRDVKLLGLLVCKGLDNAYSL